MEQPVIYFENFLTEEDSEFLLKYIENNFKLTKDKYILYGKEVFSPRKTCFLSRNKDIKYTYSGQTKETFLYDNIINRLSKEIAVFLKVSQNYFNGCLINLYKNGEDSISYHKDNELDMDKNTLIAVISLGAERNFCIKNDKSGEVTKFKLSNGSLAVMNPICQKEYKHAILKEKKVKDKRLSLTFRNFK